MTDTAVPTPAPTANPLLPDGPWPVMLTPFDAAGRVDGGALRGYAQWLVDVGATGLFPVALSGEMFELDAAERVAVAAHVVDAVAGRVPVVASALLGAPESLGNSPATERAAVHDAVAPLVQTGVAAVVFVACDVAPESAQEAEVRRRLLTVLEATSTPLGIYECPLPYHRLLSTELVGELAASGRFAFFKETSHDVARMAERVRIASGTQLRVFDAGIETLVASRAVGVAGLSGWIVTVAPDAVARLIALIDAGRTAEAVELQGVLVDVERRMNPTYPGIAKRIVELRSGVPFRADSRWRSSVADDALASELTEILEAVGA